jgi:hypothetical protein
MELLETPVAAPWIEHLMALALLLVAVATLAEALLRGLARALDAYVDRTVSKRDDALVRPWTRRMVRWANFLAGLLDAARRYMPVVSRGGR